MVESKTKGCIYDLDMILYFKVMVGVAVYSAHPYHQANLPTTH